MAITGAVIIQLGSYFLAQEHFTVFRHVAHPVVSRFLDVSVTLTLFAIGFVMFAGAGSTLEQQYGFPAWAGAGLMTLIVMATGLLDVDKVSAVISGVTPLAIVAVVGAFAYTMFHLPPDLSALDAAAVQTVPPVSPWWLSALNYAGLSLLLGVSMCLVIGGNYPNLRQAGRGGIAGGVLYTVLLLLSALALYLNVEQVGGADIPMLALMASIHPVLGHAMVVIIFAMIYNTAIGMFYALGRRLTANRPGGYRRVFLIACLAGYGVSFVGFDALMNSVYPAIGYIGMFMAVALVVAWVRRRATIAREAGRRLQLRDLLARRGRDTGEAEVGEVAQESNIEDEEIVEALRRDVAREKGEDAESDEREPGEADRSR
ncbi:YkvI family membrane protein [Agilicoccus flavus]|uniref:YkvI family membrane protein n=1 Tax=Agilicoccus flavus TaxID=2775968 RepID=UPI001CF6830A|nr:hypothetical protein [Agilicoccus flavus]